MPTFEKYWQRNGKRRPFPSLHEARRMFGSDAIDFSPPRYEMENQCPWCGGEVNNRRRRFCCQECAKEFQNMTVWNRGRDPYSLRMLYRDNFTCQDCGEFHAFVNEHNMIIPIDDGRLEVHHIDPVSEGGGDEPSNLRTLCKRCHKKYRKKVKEGNEYQTVT